MAHDEFEWDEIKSTSNFVKHGVTFDMAKDVFLDPFALDEIDARQDYGEDRYIRMGMVEGRLLVVIYTMRADVIRIISARGAESCEMREYHEQNSQN